MADLEDKTLNELVSGPLLAFAKELRQAAETSSECSAQWQAFDCSEILARAAALLEKLDRDIESELYDPKYIE
ncbi:hypothetical protein [Sinorhizobium sp. BJ1]|uniref:hypothetical protein n=1 Tax=Sinorhizobium sp. BJ1 TaxID=2035455 RepID=UPI000BE892C5|nr:hypothetical protein [Sinorhizobium sp. BJ1]PDT79947.1 hypothetical protein CO676_30315 [Sinorhizobium sp. BJ1]